MPPPKSPSITFHVKSTPFVHDVPGAPEYYENMGRVMALWGRFEFNFTTDIALGLSGVPTLKDHLSEIPVSWSRKLNAYSKCFSLVEELKPYAEQAKKFIDTARSISEKRNIVAHGSFIGFTNLDPLTAEFKMADVRKRRSLVFRQYTCALQEMKDIVTDIDGLNTRYFILSSAVSVVCNDLKMKIFRSPGE